MMSDLAMTFFVIALVAVLMHDDSIKTMENRIGHCFGCTLRIVVIFPLLACFAIQTMCFLSAHRLAGTNVTIPCFSCKSKAAFGEQGNDLRIPDLRNFPHSQRSTAGYDVFKQSETILRSVLDISGRASDSVEITSFKQDLPVSPRIELSKIIGERALEQGQNKIVLCSLFWRKSNVPSGHQNVVFQSHNATFHFDPDGFRAFAGLDYQYFLRPAYSDASYKRNHEWCGLQCTQAKLDEKGFCVTWSLFVAHVWLLNPSLSVHDVQIIIDEFLQQFDAVELRALILRYQSWLEQMAYLTFLTSFVCPFVGCTVAGFFCFAIASKNATGTKRAAKNVE